MDKFGVIYRRDRGSAKWSYCRAWSFVAAWHDGALMLKAILITKKNNGRAVIVSVDSDSRADIAKAARLARAILIADDH